MKLNTESNSRTLIHDQTRIEYRIQEGNRKSLEISVHPDQSVCVKVPRNTSLKKIEEFMRKHTAWTSRKILYFQQLGPETPPKQYQAGENHLYLGDLYPLILRPAARDRVRLQNGSFKIHHRNTDLKHIQKIMEKWYRSQAGIIFPQILDECWPLFKKDGYPKPDLKIRKMKRRWGSLSSQGEMTLNTRLIQAPRKCVEYVVYHELCHLSHYNHSPDFYGLLDRKMPNWRQIKLELETTLF